jgi:hypothetical protein
MANDLNDIVNIVIEGSLVAQAEASFTNILILGEDGNNGRASGAPVYGASDYNFTEQYIVANSPTTVSTITASGTTSKEYLAFNSIYSQKNSVGMALIANMGYGTWTTIYSAATFAT